MPVAPSPTADPLAPLVTLPGVSDAVGRVRDAVVAVHNHPANRRGFPANAAEGALRGARASAAIDGAPLTPTTSDLVSDPLLAGAVRVADEHARLVPVWKSSPLQALARLHVLAAADLVPVPRHADELGRPRPGTGDRLSLLADLVTGATAVPAPVLVAVVHGELLALAPFGTADGVVARAAARLAATASGLDPKSLVVPEVGHLRRLAEYRSAAAAFAAGGAEGVGTWVLHCCAQWEAGAREATSIAESRA
ncbi:oxidoreductase [Pseudonocardia dioxanivorans]|uniref:oxidoreductase n=1 Tax=Pseudonocardia dioxanivorans TaxID=240495 RepID=UPI000CD14C07|nr:oxidoreductase [Pseudonocardia dioxanivorans]